MVYTCICLTLATGRGDIAMPGFLHARLIIAPVGSCQENDWVHAEKTTVRISCNSYDSLESIRRRMECISCEKVSRSCVDKIWVKKDGMWVRFGFRQPSVTNSPFTPQLAHEKYSSGCINRNNSRPEPDTAPRCILRSNVCTHEGDNYALHLGREDAEEPKPLPPLPVEHR